MIQSMQVIGAGRVGSAVAARLRGARRGPGRRGARARPPLRAGRGHRGRGRLGRAGPVGRARLRRDAARRARRRTRAASPAIRCRRSSAGAGRSSSTARTRPSAARPTRRGTRASRSRELLGLEPFALAEEQAPLYHAGASVASNFLVTLHRRRGALVAEAGAPPEALVPLMRRTIENDFELTGPIQRGDWASVERQRAAVAPPRPSSRRSSTRSSRRPRSSPHEGRAHDRRAPRPAGAGRPSASRRASSRRWAPSTRAISSLFRAAREGERHRRREPLRQPDPVRAGRGSRALPARRGARRSSSREAEGVDYLFAPPPDELYPPGFQTWVDVEELGSSSRARTARATSAASRPSA